jgi:fumarate reductase flavoprotein subunit
MARVLKKDGSLIPNLYAGGGVAVGVSGSGVKGYMSGNGLLAATVLGKLAGDAASLAIKAGE